MKKFIIAASLILALSACDNTSNKTTNSQITFQNNQKLSSSAMEIKNYTAAKDNVQRQHYILDYTKSLVAADQELTKALEALGYTRQVKNESSNMAHLYFKKPKNPIVVAVFKSTQENKTRLSLSWALTQ